MGSAESKLSVHNKLSRLWTENDIPTTDVAFWNYMLGASVGTPNALYSLITASEIRKLRDEFPENMETLVQLTQTRLVQSTNHSALGASAEAQLLSNIRILTRVFPYIYESSTQEHRSWMERFLWASPNCTGTLLIERVTALLNFPGFSIPMHSEGIWTAGIGSAITLRTTKGMTGARIELIRLLLSVCSEPLYNLHPRGLDHAVSAVPQQNVIYVLLSLLNTTLRHNQLIWNRPFEEGFILDAASQLSRLSLQALVLLITHLPEDPGKINRYRMFLARIHQPQDIQFLTEYLISKLEKEQPAAELVSLLWELIQANSTFRAHLTEDNAASREICHALVIQFKAYRYASECENTLRIISYILLGLSNSPQWCTLFASGEVISLLQPFSQFDTHIPVLLDLMYNCSPYLVFNAETSRSFVAFLESLNIVTTGHKSRDLLKETVVRSVELALVAHFDENKVLLTELAKANSGEKLGSKWLQEVISLSALPTNKPQQTLVSFRPIQFTWDSKSLRWYSSVLWARIYQAELERGGVGVWNDTHVELFKVEKAVRVPSLSRPRGALDAVADSIMDSLKERLFGRSE